MTTIRAKKDDPATQTIARRFCPECGQQVLRLIEVTEPDSSGEYKEIHTCDDCQNIVYLVRSGK